MRSIIVLVILDRNIDLIPMLSHSWTYQALVHDVLEMKLNRVSVEVCLALFQLSMIAEMFFPHGRPLWRTARCRRSPTISIQRISSGRNMLDNHSRVSLKQ